MVSPRLLTDSDTSCRAVGRSVSKRSRRRAGRFVISEGLASCSYSPCHRWSTRYRASPSSRSASSARLTPYRVNDSVTSAPLTGPARCRRDRRGGRRSRGARTWRPPPCWRHRRTACRWSPRGRDRLEAGQRQLVAQTSALEIGIDADHVDLAECVACGVRADAASSSRRRPGGRRVRGGGSPPDRTTARLRADAGCRSSSHPARGARRRRGC